MDNSELKFAFFIGEMLFNVVQGSSYSLHSHCRGRKFETCTAHQFIGYKKDLRDIASPFLIAGLVLVAAEKMHASTIYAVHVDRGIPWSSKYYRPVRPTSA